MSLQRTSKLSVGGLCQKLTRPTNPAVAHQVGPLSRGRSLQQAPAESLVRSRSGAAPGSLESGLLRVPLVAAVEVRQSFAPGLSRCRSGEPTPKRQRVGPQSAGSSRDDAGALPLQAQARREVVAQRRADKFPAQDGQALRLAVLRRGESRARYQALVEFMWLIAAGLHLELSEARMLSREEANCIDKTAEAGLLDLFWGGYPASECTALMAAVAWKWPQLGKFGNRSLPFARQAALGFAKEDPRRERLPLPRAVVAAIANELALQGNTLAGVAVMLMLCCYFRPGEVEALRVWQVTEPMLRQARSGGRSTSTLESSASAARPATSTTRSRSIRGDSTGWALYCRSY